MRPEPIQMPTTEAINQTVNYIDDTVKDLYIPSAEELRTRHELRISFFTSGCVVHVGCKSIAFNDYKDAVKEIELYINNPVEAYKRWSKTLNVGF